MITKAPKSELVTLLQSALRPHLSWFVPELDRDIRQLHAGLEDCNDANILLKPGGMLTEKCQRCTERKLQHQISVA